ncbi:MAG: helix-turn-helix transcriptional regulator [Bacteroidota bacterium]
MKDFLATSVGNAIARHRKKNKIDQQELAERIGSTQGSIANIEAGRQMIPLPKIYAVATVLGIEIEQLIPKKGEFIVALYDAMKDHLNFDD